MTTKKIIEEASMLSLFERAQLIDELISTLDKPDKEIEKLWSIEAEDRIDAYNKGKLMAVSLEEVLRKYQ